MGSSFSSQAKRIDKALGTSFPENERIFGLENFGNTCYCNSVLQALYYCKPLREVCLQQTRKTSQILLPPSLTLIPLPRFAALHRRERAKA